MTFSLVRLTCPFGKKSFPFSQVFQKNGDECAELYKAVYYRKVSKLSKSTCISYRINSICKL